MMKGVLKICLWVTVLLVVCVSCSGQIGERDIEYPALAKEIKSMRDEDQKYRRKYVSLLQKGKEKTAKFDKVTQTLIGIDRKNTARMKEIVKQYGWPTKKAVGKGVSNSAWLVVQHADRDPVFQQECLALLKTAMENDEIDPVNYAFLYDRVQLAMGKKQKYATQSTRNEYTNESFFQAIEDEANVQKRRAEMGFDRHVEEYATRVGFEYKVPSAEEAKQREEKLRQSYESSIKKAKEAFAKKEYGQAADYFIQASYCDGYMSNAEYVQTAKAISLANYEEKGWWGYTSLMKAALRGWEGISDVDTNPDFANLKKASPTNWKDLMNTVEQLLQPEKG